LFLSFPTRRSSDLASAIPRPASTSALAGSGAVSAVSAAAGVLSGVDSLAFVAEGVASSAGAEDFTLDVGLSATAAEAVDESVVAADEGVFLAGVDLAPAEDSAAVFVDEEFFTVFVSVFFPSAVFLLADGFAVEDFFVVEAVAAEVLRVPDFAAVAPEPPAFVPAVVDRVVDFFVADADPLVLLVAVLSSDASVDL